MQELSNKTANGKCRILVSRMDEFFYVSENSNKDNQIFTVNEELPDEDVTRYR